MSDSDFLVVYSFIGSGSDEYVRFEIEDRYSLWGVAENRESVS